MITLEHISKNYRLGNSTVPALSDVSMAIEHGEFLAIAGPSGSGKSTLLNIIGCIESPTSGMITMEGMAMDRLTSNQRAHWRATKLGFVFQTFNLLPVLTAYENVEYPLYLKGVGGKERRQRVCELMADVGLESLLMHRPSQLSGGQRQRVAIARALATEPLLVLADEPTANLDPQTGTEILELMKNLNEKKAVTFVFSTHDPKILAQARRIVRISAGRIDLA